MPDVKIDIEEERCLRIKSGCKELGKRWLMGLGACTLLLLFIKETGIPIPEPILVLICFVIYTYVMFGK